MGSGPGEGTQSSTLGPLKLDLGPVQLSAGNSCDIRTPSNRPHANKANGQLFHNLITADVIMSLSLQGFDLMMHLVWTLTTEFQQGEDVKCDRISGKL